MVFTYACWAGSITEKRSTSRFMLSFGSIIVPWRSK